MPNLSNIRIFGSLVYNKEPSNFTKKLDSKATPYHLIGFIGDNIYKICNPKTNKIITKYIYVAVEMQPFSGWFGRRFWRRFHLA